MKTNQIIVTGNVGADPELHKKSEESSGVVSFSVAESIARLNEKTGKYEQAHTNWFPVRAFGSLGDRIKSSLKKGNRVTVFGRLKTYQYENPDGRRVSAFEIMADDVSLSGILPKVTENPVPDKNMAADGAADSPEFSEF